MTKQEAIDIGILKTQQKTTNESLKRIEQTLIAFDERLERRFAAKWVERVVTGAVVAILLGFMGVAVSYFIPGKSTPNATAQIVHK